MKTFTVVSTLAIGAVLGLSLGLAPQPQDDKPQPAPQTGGETFLLDTVHSSAVFKIQHMGVSNFYGRFNDIEGTYMIDASNPANSRFDVRVKTDSVDTKVKKRDDHLRSPDFFNAAEYPALSFKSIKVEKKGDNLSVTGDLTMHGVTKPITVDMKVFPAKQTQQGYKGGFETMFTVKRTDFGMDTYVAEGGLGDEVTVIVAGEGAKQK